MHLLKVRKSFFPSPRNSKTKQNKKANNLLQTDTQTLVSLKDHWEKGKDRRLNSVFPVHSSSSNIVCFVSKSVSDLSFGLRHERRWWTHPFSIIATSTLEKELTGYFVAWGIFALLQWTQEGLKSFLLLEFPWAGSLPPPSQPGRLRSLCFLAPGKFCKNNEFVVKSALPGKSCHCCPGNIFTSQKHRSPFKVNEWMNQNTNAFISWIQNPCLQ